MHIADGVLATEVWVSGYIATGVVTAFSLRKVPSEEIPRLAIVTAAYFVASLLHFPLGPTSIHLTLNGLCGVILGWGAVPSILVGVALQALLFQHGGLTTIGVNAFNMGVGGVVAFGLFRLRRYLSIKGREMVFGFCGGAVGVFIAVLLLCVALLTTGEAFGKIARLALVAHLPLCAIEGVIVGFAAAFLAKVKPEVLK